ncbi:thiolase, C-terminal domain protein [Aeromicrobium marinum DSM 15272]|uniref:propanoyl-CoA C-acyltransferase n=1 Tax=Aeromicrobium marinum DSM 15272 TaxID=585531 RepID=E2S821_9ACTN|nr:acetyl-CoA acetyltransferase [Aeromicrobium marinum]EFQ84837.1 thiolase, C-terminal domain protein [Aeromicrobium marinum DSM 15272]
MDQDLYVLGGAQTDFARNWAAEGVGLFEVLTEVLPATFTDARVVPGDVEVIHVGNLAAEMFAGQAQLGGLVVAAEPQLAGLPSTRHEAACASGSTAIVAAGADIASGRYDVALVVGIEQMRNVPAQTAADHLGTAAWAGREALDATYTWPALFADVAEEYDARYGLDHDPLGRFAEIAFANAADNPLAQARDWSFGTGSFSEDDDANPLVEGRLRRTDCGRITDGAAAVVVAGAAFARRWAAEHGLELDQVPRISGFGHRTDTLLLEDKFAASRGGEHLFPHLHGTVHDAYRRAGLSGIDDIDVVEMHDCFSITGLVTLEHLGLVGGGKGPELIHDGSIERTGRLPVNPGGGLLAAGHPVGATGVRMVLDAARQVTGTAGAQQIEGARRVLTVNVGGSFTTAVSFVVETTSP